MEAVSHTCSTSQGARKKPQRLPLTAGREKAQSPQTTSLAAGLIVQWAGETSWTPANSEEPLRLIARKQLIDTSDKHQASLFLQERYRYVVTNLPPSWSVEDVIDETYKRCDQENVIEQLGSGLAMWRMPVKEFVGNEAWLEIARLAWNMRAWIAQLCLPEEVIRWEWKRFRKAFLSNAHAKLGCALPARFVALLAEAHAKL